MSENLRRSNGDDLRVGPWRSLLWCALGFTLALGAWLALAGLRTSGFALSMGPGLLLLPLGLAFLAYLVAGALSLLPRLLRRRASEAPSPERPPVFAMAAVTSWVALGLTFLPLKGSETFVDAGTLTTLQLNVIGLAGVIVAGLIVGWTLSLVVSWFVRMLRSGLPRRALRIVSMSLPIALLALILLGGGIRTTGSGVLAQSHGGSSSVPRVAIIGVDGCDWEKLGPLVEQGRLPTFERLMRQGAHGTLLSLDPLISPVIWTTIATGKTADKHGIAGFVNASGVPVNATMRTALPLWDIASAAGVNVGVTGWYVSWPAEPVEGFLVSDRVHSLLRGPTQIVQTLRGAPTNARLERFGRFSFDPGYKGYPKAEKAYQQNRIVDEPLRWGYLRDTIYGRLAALLLPRYAPAFSAVYFRGVDFVQHFFWKYGSPELFDDVTADDIAAYGDVIPEYYVYQDALLDRHLKALGPEANVIIVSDHGFTSKLDIDPKMPQLTGMHDRRGVIIVSGPAFRAAGRFEGATILDVAPTALAVMGLPIAEDMDGRVLSEVIREEHLAEYPVTYVPTYEPDTPRERHEVGSSMDESIKDRLRSLGYLE